VVPQGMPSVFAKLNLKNPSHIVVLDAPASFQRELATLPPQLPVKTSAAASATIEFALAFVMTQEGVDRAARELAAKAPGDAVIWFAYPKGTSKRYRCEFNRDNGWASLGALGFEPVRMVAIDEDWSALRFRRAEHIKQLTRAPQAALSAEGKARPRAAKPAKPAAKAAKAAKPAAKAAKPAKPAAKAAKPGAKVPKPGAKPAKPGAKVAKPGVAKKALIPKRAAARKGAR
jgi:hypothetical protein